MPQTVTREIRCEMGLLMIPINQQVHTLEDLVKEGV